jgi:hypothetical protein
MKIYHYTSTLSLRQVLGRGGEPSGLVPRKQKAIFALLEPTPESWVHNPDFPTIWGKLISYLGPAGIVLTEVEIDPLRDNVVVADRAHCEGILRPDQDIPSRYLYPSDEEAQEAFDRSKIHILDYLRLCERGELAYSLPEILITNPVASERVSVSNMQPLLEGQLVSHVYGRDWIVSRINSVLDKRYLAVMLYYC